MGKNTGGNISDTGDTMKRIHFYLESRIVYTTTITQFSPSGLMYSFSKMLEMLASQAS